MKTLIEGDRAFIPAHAYLQCECGHSWQTTRGTRPKLSTGVRCPKCRSRNVCYPDGTRVIPLKQQQKRQNVPKKMKTTMASPGEERIEEVKKIRRPPVSEGVTEIEVVSAIKPERKKTLQDLKEKFRKGEGPGALPADEDLSAVAAGGAPPTSIFDEALLEEIFDIETFIVAHEFEVELIAQAMKKDVSSVDISNVINTMSRKMQTLLRLIFRDMTIPTAIKVVLFLYAINQMTLVGTIAKAPSLEGTAEGPETEVEELPKKKTPGKRKPKKK